MVLLVAPPAIGRDGDAVEKLVRIDLGSGATGAERLKSSGLGLDMSGGEVMVTNVRLGSQAAKYGITPGDTVLSIATPADRPAAQWFMLPALAILAVVVMLQRARRRSQRRALPSAA